LPLLPNDPAYPASLLAPLDHPVLYVRGRLPSSPGVAIVGTRQPTDEAVAFTRDLATALVRHGIAVWSGGAAGIDAAAHEAALDAAGLTVLVAGGGLDCPYPPAHRGLFERVVAFGGASLARVPDGTPPTPPGFLQRNAILAALTTVTVVVQAPLVSGARSTAAAARRLGRTLCVVPHAPWDERGRGCALELARGALPVCSPADVLAALGRPAPAPTRKKTAVPTLPLPLHTDPEPASAPPPTPAEAALLATLSDQPLHFDEACERAGLSAKVANAALLTLTLRAVVVEGPAGFFRRLPPASVIAAAHAGSVQHGLIRHAPRRSVS
jgi:DNA processing protein